MKNTYKIDFVNNTLTMSKAFEEALNNPNSEEYKLFLQLRADFPGLTIIRKTRRAPKKARPTKNLTYKHMEQYMNVFQNADKLLAQFEVVKECSKQQPSPYKFVKDWFEDQFPKYKNGIQNERGRYCWCTVLFGYVVINKQKHLLFRVHLQKPQFYQ